MMYVVAPDDRIYQGDILKDCNLVLPPPNRLNVNLTSHITTTDPTTQTREYRGNAIVLTQTCDVQDNDIVHLAVVIKLDDFKNLLTESGKSDSTVESVVGQLKSKKPHYKETGLFQWFYLPPDGELEESIALLNFIVTVNKNDLNAAHRIAYLSDRSRQWLQYYLMRLLGRPFWEE